MIHETRFHAFKYLSMYTNVWVTSIYHFGSIYPYFYQVFLYFKLYISAK